MANRKIPKLPFGQGSISEFNDELLVYKKTITLNDGRKLRKATYGKTANECMIKMQELEKELFKNNYSADKEPLIDAMTKWLELTKKPTLKPQSYSRLASTLRNQIEPSSIGHSRYQSITSDELQQLIADLNNQNYAKSTIKKVYDCLNDFYRYSSAKYKFDNPMLLVTMPIDDNVKAEEREIKWFEESDIVKFRTEAGAKYKTGTPKYPFGLAYAANIFLGLRGGELLALQWEDIDFEAKTIHVYKTLIEEANPDYNASDPSSRKVRFTVQKSTKTSNTRYVPINDKAMELLKEHKKVSKFTEPSDYVISTRNRKTSTIKNMNDGIKAICKSAETDEQDASSHSLRHTCASLYFRAGVPIEVIANILGHSVDVCRKTYLHFVEEQLKDAASKIVIYDI